MRLFIVIPTLDEAENLSELLPALLPIADGVCVADGGSRDGSLELARRLGAQAVAAPRGRGSQLQTGAAAAVGDRERDDDVLLFLHADSRLPEAARESIEAALFGEGAAGRVGGAFRIRFGGGSHLLRLGARLANWRARACPFGDHAIFVRRQVFEELGGFRDWPLLEDVDFARRLARRGPTVLLPGVVETSARRFERRGILRTVATNWLILLLFFAGVSPQRLYRLYYGRPAPARAADSKGP